MPLVYCDSAEASSLGGVLSVISAGGISLLLFKNNYVPVDGTVLADLTEADFSGYAAGSGAFGGVAEVGGVAVATGTAPVDFIHNGGGTANTIYGYYLYSAGLALVVYAERFSAPITMASAGNKISITLQLTLDSANH